MNKEEFIHILKENKWNLEFNLHNEKFEFKNMKYLSFSNYVFLSDYRFDEYKKEINFMFSSVLYSLPFAANISYNIHKKENMLEITLISKKYKFDGLLRAYFMSNPENNFLIEIFIEDVNKLNIIENRLEPVIIRNRYELIDI